MGSQKNLKMVYYKKLSMKKNMIELKRGCDATPN
jgi:hypothetical protein